MATGVEGGATDWSRPIVQQDLPSGEGLEEVKIGINGAGGTIGMATLERVLRTLGPQALGALNDPGANPETMAYLLRHRPNLEGHDIRALAEGDKSFLSFAGHRVPLLRSRDPREIEWKYHEVRNLVIDCSGRFKNRDTAGRHILGLGSGGRVLISAPPDGEVDKVITYGVNDDDLSLNDRIVSAASCTTMAAATLLKAIREIISEQGVEVLFLNLLTVHAYTMDQALQPNSAQKKPTRARPVEGNIIPTTTGAAKALKRVMPDLEIALHGMADRVNQADVSKILLGLILSGPIAMDVIHVGLRQRVGRLIGFDADHGVSSDFKGDTHSVTYSPDFDGQGQFTLGNETGGFLQLGGWYDNVDGYVARLVDLAFQMLRQSKK